MTDKAKSILKFIVGAALLATGAYLIFGRTTFYGTYRGPWEGMPEGMKSQIKSLVYALPMAIFGGWLMGSGAKGLDSRLGGGQRIIVNGVPVNAGEPIVIRRKGRTININDGTPIVVNREVSFVEVDGGKPIIINREGQIIDAVGSEPIVVNREGSSIRVERDGQEINIKISNVDEKKV